MKKTLSSILSLITVLVLMLSLTGCSEQKKFVGTWETTVDMTDFVNQGFAEDPELAEYLEIEEFSLVLKMCFYEDGTYTAYVDEEMAQKTIDSLKKDLKNDFIQYFEDFIASAGLPLSVDEVLAESGTDIDSLVEESFGDDFFESMVEGFASEGIFEAKAGNLYRSAGLDKNIDENVYETYEFSDNKLLLLASFGDDIEELEDMNLYPMTFTKVG